MRQVEPWHHYFMEMADHVATRSKDPSTQVGAVIVNTKQGVVETGYNGFGEGVRETEERWQRPIKYEYVIHAEQNAISRAARFGKITDDTTLYCTHFPCKVCAKSVIAAGIKRIFYKDYVASWSPEEIAFVKAMFEEANVSFCRYPG